MTPPSRFSTSIRAEAVVVGELASKRASCGVGAGVFSTLGAGGSSAEGAMVVLLDR